jgi:hypothetical protein
MSFCLSTMDDAFSLPYYSCSGVSSHLNGNDIGGADRVSGSGDDDDDDDDNNN